MSANRHKFDLKDAFGAPPASYARRTRATLDSLEEGEQVKKTAYGTVLAIACALLLMTTGLAAGLNGVWHRDNIAGDAQSLSGGQGAIATRAVDESVEATVDKALFDGRMMYVKVKIDAGNEGNINPDYTTQFKVNGKIPETIFGWLAVYDGYSVYEGLFDCGVTAADSAVLTIDIGDANSGRTFTEHVTADADMRYYALEQAESLNMPEAAYGYAIACEGGFAYANLRYDFDPDNAEEAEAIERLSLAQLSVSEDGDARFASRMSDGSYSIGVDYSGGLPDAITLNAVFGEGNSASAGSAAYRLTEVDWNTVEQPKPMAMDVYTSESQFDGELLHVRASVDADVDVNGGISLNVNGLAPEELGGFMTIEGEGGRKRHIYDMLYRCEPAELASVSVSSGAEDDRLFAFETRASGHIERFSVSQVDADASFVGGWAANGPGFGMARLMWLPEDEKAAQRLEDIFIDGHMLEVNGAEALITTRLVRSPETGLNGVEIDVYCQSRLPEKFILSGNDGASDLTFELTESADALSIYDELSADATPRVEPVDVLYNGEYLCLEYDITMRGVELYDGVIGLSSEEGAIEMPFDGGSNAVSVESCGAEVNGAPLKNVYMRVSRIDESDLSRLRCLAVYECAAGDSASGEIVVEAGGMRVASAFSAESEPNRIRALSVDVESNTSEIEIIAPMLLETDGVILLNLAYRPTDMDVMDADGINSVTLYSPDGDSDTTLMYDADGRVTACVLQAAYEKLPDSGELVLYVSSPYMELDAPITLKVRDAAALNVFESAVDGNYTYAIAEIRPEAGKRAQWSRGADLLGDVTERLLKDMQSGEADAAEVKAQLENVPGRYQSIFDSMRLRLTEGKTLDLTADEVRSMLASASGNENTETEIIGGADGPTGVIVSDGTKSDADAGIGVIGGTDGPTSILVNGGTKSDADAGTTIIGGADGPTSVIVSGGTKSDADASIGVIGGADGPTSIFVNGGDIALVGNPRMTAGGRDITLGVIECGELRADGTLTLLLVGEPVAADEEIAVSCELDGRTMQARQNVHSSGEQIARAATVAGQPYGMGITALSVAQLGEVAFVDATYTLEGDMPIAEGAYEVFFDGGAAGTDMIALAPNALNIPSLKARSYYIADGDGYFHGDFDCVSAGAGEDSMKPVSYDKAAEMGKQSCPMCVGNADITVLSAEGSLNSLSQDASSFRLTVTAGEGGYKLCRVCLTVPCEAGQPALFAAGAGSTEAVSANAVTYTLPSGQE